GAWRAIKAKGRKAVVTTPIEHKAVLGAVHQAGHEGAEERFLAMTSDGVVDRSSFDQLVDDDVAVCSMMWVNNEIGTIQPVPELAAKEIGRASCRERGEIAVVAGGSKKN